MSYTLRGRIESRLAAFSFPLAAACAIGAATREWWPLALAGAMIGVSLALDVAAFHPLLRYQPGWTAVPLGLLELGLLESGLVELGLLVLDPLLVLDGLLLLGEVLELLPVLGEADD